MKYAIWLQLCLGYGHSNIKEIFDYFGDAKNIFKTKISNLENSKLFTNKELLKFKNTDLSQAEEIIKQCKQNDIKAIAFNSKEYPYSLSVIENPPIVIYYKGVLPDFEKIPSICIVGPRNVSDFGKKSAYSLGFRLAKAGFIVVSGGALGTDTYAHAGAIKAGGKTVLCMGNGIMSNYLPENEKLRNTISDIGCLISEYPPFSPPSKYTFPVRNRIMSALSLGTVVIEAGTRSGSLITARHAYEQGRDVFVIPGLPNDKRYTGSNNLLRDGAKPLLDVSDIFNEYILRFPDKINIEKAFETPIINNKKKECEKNCKKVNLSLSKEAEIVYNQLDKQKFFPEEIKNTGLTSQKLLSALTELEMEFLIKALPGGMYEKM